MKTHNLILVFLILFSIILSASSYLVYTNDFTQNKDELVSESDIISPKKTYPSINKALSLNTTTIYSGEDIRISVSNGSLAWFTSTYQYNSINNITHLLMVPITIPLTRGHQDIEISAPDHWNFSSVDPDDDVVVYNPSDNDYSFDMTHAPGDVLYNFTFLSGDGYGRLKKTYNNYLTIDDNSDSYLSDNGFESGFSDWTNSSFDSVELNTTVKYAGTNSIMLTDADASEDIFTLNQSLDLRGEYYISVPIYVDGTMGVNTGVVLQYYDGGWNNYTISGNLNYTDRWQPNRFFIHPTDEESNIEFRIIFLGSGQILIDEFQIWEVNSQILSSATIHNYNVSSSLISFDSRQNFGVNSERVDYNITLTNTDANQDSTSLTTDSNGFSSYIYVNTTLDEAQLTVSTNSQYYFPYNTFSNLQNSEVLRTDMNDGSTLFLNDLSTNGFRGTIDGADWVSSDIQGNVLLFNDINTDFVDHGDEDEFSFTDGNDTSFSISCWIKPNSFTGTDTIISKFDAASGLREWQFVLSGNDPQMAMAQLNNVNNRIEYRSGETLVVDQWIFLIVTYNGDETAEGINIYYNSTVASTPTYINAGTYPGMSNTASRLIIGAADNVASTNNHFNGTIDGLRLYDKELSQSEINYLFQPDQQFQCQPRQTTDRPFNYETKSDGSLNEWDWKEGDNEDSKIVETEYTLNTIDGFLNASITTPTSRADLNFASLSINSDIYTDLSLKIRGSNTQLYLKIWDSSSNNLITPRTLSTDFVVIDKILPSDWDGIESSISIIVENATGGLLNKDVSYFQIDYIRLIHVNTPEFEYSLNLAKWWLNSENDSYTYKYWDSAGSTIMDNTWIDKTIGGPLEVTYSAYLDSEYSNIMLLPSTNATGIMPQYLVKDDYGYFFFLGIGICVGIIFIIVLLAILKMTFSMFKRR